MLVPAVFVTLVAVVAVLSGTGFLVTKQFRAPPIVGERKQRRNNPFNRFAMRFFRDLSRSKARRRRYGKDYALVPLLLGKEAPIVQDTLNNEPTATFTFEELASYNVEDVLYLSIKGRVYDVSAGAKFYGPSGPYHAFVGTDASRAFATACRDFDDKENCLTSNLDNLTPKQLRELDKWVELYELHDKYQLVGRLVQDPVNDLLAADEAAAAN
jgi:membrane-associated progesterone receptor component